MEEFKYLWALWGRGAQEINRQIGTMTAEMRMLQWSVVVKRAVHKSKALNLDPLTCGHKLCLPGFWSVSGDHVFSFELLEQVDPGSLWSSMSSKVLLHISLATFFRN